METPRIRAAQERLHAAELKEVRSPEGPSPASRARLIRALDQLARLSAAFEDAKIGWVLVKGAGLSLTAWPDPFVRPFSDLDVFVAPASFGAAVLELTRLGYVTETVPDASQVHWTFHREDSFPVELHHVFSREFDAPRALVERFVATGVPVATGGPGVLRVPDPVAHLAYVLLHAYNHGWQLSPSWALDVFFLLERQPEILAPALAFFPRLWPVALSLRVAALVVPALADRLVQLPAPSLRERALGAALAVRLDRGGISAADSALLRVLASPSPATTLMSMVSRLR